MPESQACQQVVLAQSTCPGEEGLLGVQVCMWCVRVHMCTWVCAVYMQCVLIADHMCMCVYIAHGCGYVLCVCSMPAVVDHVCDMCTCGMYIYICTHVGVCCVYNVYCGGSCVRGLCMCVHVHLHVFGLCA